MYYNARYYDPLTGRFTQPDTIIPDRTNPKDLNRYTYVRSSPTNYADPSGHCSTSMILNGCGGDRGEDLPDQQRACLANGRACPPSIFEVPRPGSGSGGRMPVEDLSPSERVVDLLRDAEFPVATPYNDGCFPPDPGCSVGNCTVGIGHLIHAGPCSQADFDEWGTLTTSEMEDLFRDEIAFETGRLPEAILVQLTQYEYDALVLLSFNAGRNAVPGSNLAAEINRGPKRWDESVIIGEWDWGSAQFDQFPGLRIRREAEVMLFLSGHYPGSI